jgi:flagellar L-ring protein FlgH
VKLLLIKSIKAIILFSLISCSSFVKKMHSNIDQKDKQPNMRNNSLDPFEMYRKENLRKSKKYNVISNKYQEDVTPSIKRKYESANVKKRKNDYDVFNNTKDGSLWTGTGQNNYFFSRNNEKNIGDIIIIQVEKGLRSMIAEELKRKLSMPKITKKSKTKSDKDSEKPEEKTEAKKPNNKKATNKAQVFDNISSVVIEKINNEHYLLRGKKEVLFKNVKHLIEIQGLISKKLINNDDRILSSNLIEKYVRLIK